MPLSPKPLILYSEFVDKLALEDESLTGMAQRLAALRMQEGSPTSSMRIQPPRSTGSENLGPEKMRIVGQVLLPSDTRAKVLKEIQSTLNSIDQVMNGQAGSSDFCVLQELPKSIQALKENVGSTRKELASQQKSLTELVHVILKARETLNREIEQGLSSTLPAHCAARSSQVDLLCATIEASLVKLALGRARAENTLYNQIANDDATKNMTHALETAWTALKTEERTKQIELCRLDKDLREYEAVLDLVDCGQGGYQQLINDWTKVQEDTDECLKDLRRLGWTGD